MIPARLRHTYMFKLLLVLGLVGLGDWLFYRQPVGATAGLFGLALLGAYLLTQRQVLRTARGGLAVLASLGLCLALLIYPRLLTFVLFLISLGVMIGCDRQSGQDGVIGPLRSLLARLCDFFARTFRDRRIMRRYARRRGKASSRRNLLRLMMVPTLLALIFISLFSMANPVLGNALSRFDLGVFARLLEPTRWVFWLLLAFFAYALLRPRMSIPPLATLPLPNASGWLTKESLVASLAVFNLIFGLQNGMDLAFLWGGHALPEGVSHAQYARAGAYPLIITTCLAAAYVLLVFSDRQQNYHSRWAEGLVYLWIVQNMLLVASAITRLSEYIAAYSLTYLRLSALLWMGLIGLGLLLIILRLGLRRSNSWLMEMNAAMLAALLYTCCFINFDIAIARYNVQYAREMRRDAVPLDLRYMASLGPDAAIRLDWFAYYADPATPIEKIRAAQRLAYDLRVRAYADYTANWRNWTLRTYLNPPTLPEGARP